MNHLRDKIIIGLLGMLIVSRIHGNTHQQTLFYSPDIETAIVIDAIKQAPLQFTYYFDLHHVLFRYCKKPFLSSATKIKKKTKFFFQGLRVAFSKNFWKNAHQLHKGGIKVTEAYLGSLEKYKTLHQGLIQFMNDMYIPDQKMYDHIAVLKKDSHDIFLLSNIGPKLLADLQEKYPAFFVNFNRKTNTINYSPTTQTEWLSKPHITSYQHALTIGNKSHAPWTCVFVDDKLENIQGALKAGLNAILFVSPEQFKRDVQLLSKRFARIKTSKKISK